MRQAILAGATALAITTGFVSPPAAATESAPAPAAGSAASPAVINEAPKADAPKLAEVAKPAETVAPTPAAAPAAAPASVATEIKAQVAPAAPAVVAKPEPPATTLRVSIDLTSQRMTVTENGQTAHSWPISSGRAGYRTPNGTFRPTWMSKMHYSRKYDNAPMPHAVFFTGGFAIHGTYATGMLGRPASHGCVRLAPSNAKTLFNMVSRHGRASTQISLHGTARDSSPRVARSSRPKPATTYASDYWGFGYESAAPVAKPRYRSAARPAPRQGQPKIVYRNGQAYMYVGPQAAKQYWRKNSYSGGYSAY